MENNKPQWVIDKNSVGSDKKLFFPSAERNKQPILDILKKHIAQNQTGKVLEVASGTGQHISHFASYFKNLIFQPSECDLSLHESIQAYANETNNIKGPVEINASDDNWNLPSNDWDYMINVNMIHVSPFSATIGLFKNASRLLKSGGLLFTYGAYANNGVLKPESNVKFDKEIREKNPDWGIRDIEDLKKLAKTGQIDLVEINEMPANNKCLVWKKL